MDASGCGPYHQANWPPGKVRHKNKGYFSTTSPSTATRPSSLAVDATTSGALCSADNALLAVPSSARLSRSSGNCPATTPRPFNLARLLDSTFVLERVRSLASRSPYLPYPFQKLLQVPDRSGSNTSKMTRFRFSESGDPYFARLYSDEFPEMHRLDKDFVKKYRLGSLLGSGGFGFVMDACDRATGLEVAVKFLKISRVPPTGWLSHVDYPDRLDRLKETHILDRVEHPGIVTLIELFRDDLYIYIVQELHGCPWAPQAFPPLATPPLEADTSLFSSPSSSSIPLSPLDLPLRTYTGSVPKAECDCDECKSCPVAPSTSAVRPPCPTRPPAIRRPSHDLFQFLDSIDSKVLSESTAKLIFGQLVDVVLYLERLGITHNDIKDENIVIDEYFRIKLIDFGGATIRDLSRPAPYMTTFHGTKDFAAPEIRRKMVYQTPPAEIWALGMLLTYLVAGLKPFEEDEHENINGPIILKVPEGVDLSIDLLDIIFCCLKVSPLERIKIEDLAKHPWLDGWREDLAEIEKTRIVRHDRDAAFLRSKRRLEAAAIVERAGDGHSYAGRWPRSFADIEPKVGEEASSGDYWSDSSEFDESDTECF